MIYVLLMFLVYFFYYHIKNIKFISSVLFGTNILLDVSLRVVQLPLQTNHNRIIFKFKSI